MDGDLTRLQCSTLNILKIVVPILEKHDLKYSMLGGTLLGAVRHKGFIPWDDDIDIGLPRPDYEKFVQIAENELDAPLEVQSAIKGNGHYPYIRIVNTQQKLLRTAGVKDAVINVWVDVFPIDGIPNGFMRYIWRPVATLSLKLYVVSDYSYMVDREGRKNNSFRKLVRKAFERFHLERLINSKLCARFLNAILKSTNYYRCNRVCNFMGYWGSKEEFPKEIYDEMKLYPFETLKLMGPQNYDFVLKQMYGDYMTPIPEEERDHHKAIFLD